MLLHDANEAAWPGGGMSHPFADLLPPMTSAGYAELRESIRANGQREPIVLHRDGRIIDGRHRALACEELRIEVVSRVFDGPDSEILQVVLDANLRRRHLDDSQRAMIAAGVETLHHGQRADYGRDANLHVCARPDAARMLDVSPRSVASAAVVRERGIPALIQLVERGNLAVSLAAKVAMLPSSRQEQAVADAKTAKHVVMAERRRTIIEELSVATLAERDRLGTMERYPLVVLDPATKFDTWSEKGKDRTNPDNHYYTMEMDEIAALKLPLADRALVCIWSASPIHNRMLRIVEDCWGLTYKAVFIWDKLRIGTGYWGRSRYELLILATQGDGLPVPLPSDRTPNGFIEMAREHSRKPEAFYEWVEHNFDVPKLEMFARIKRPGWSAWGNEVVDASDDA